MTRTIPMVVAAMAAATPCWAQGYDPGALEQDGNLVRQVEETLKQEGYLAGTPDGTFDDETRQALSRFQQARAVPVTGHLDTETLSSLGIEGSVAQAPDSSRVQNPVTGDSPAEHADQPR